MLVAQKFMPVKVTHNSSPVETEATSVAQFSVSYLFKVSAYIYILYIILYYIIIYIIYIILLLYYIIRMAMARHNSSLHESVAYP